MIYSRYKFAGGAIARPSGTLIMQYASLPSHTTPLGTQYNHNAVCQPAKTDYTQRNPVPP